MAGFNSAIKPLIKPGLNLLSRPRLPKLDGELSMAGLNAVVEVRRDALGIPHIYAQNLRDLLFAQGFVHAQDRLWQMEFNRRLVAGRLSELLGSLAIPADRWMRTLTMRRVAEFEAGLLDEQSRAWLQAYANGVNAFIAKGRLPIEFTLLRFKPEPWVIADSLAWVKMMAWSLSVNWEMEILRAQVVARLGPELAAELEPPQPGRWPFIVPPGSDYSYIGDQALERARASRPFSGPSPYAGLGSNNWVLAGQRTASGKPLLANDMHLSLLAPAIWYENHLDAGDLAVTGVTFPGIPLVISGHNGHVAWGYTNGFPDVQDLYMERLRRTVDGDVQAEYNGQWEPVRTLREKILVKGAQTEVEEVIITRHGPVINILAPDFTGEQPLALRWTALDPDTMIASIFKLPLSRNCQELRQHLRGWTTPAQNVVYADTNGEIGYTLAGKIPVRAVGCGRLPVPGWTDEYEWIGYLPFDALPHLENPPQGYIATANNRAFSDDYPIRIELEPISGDRAQRIAELILNIEDHSGVEKIDRAYIQSMQFDQVSPSARSVLRYLTQLPLNISAHYPETELHAAVRLFKDWHGELLPDSAAAALYQAFIRQLARMILEAKLGEATPATAETSFEPKISLAERLLGYGPNPVLAENSLFGERWLPWLTQIMAEPDSHWFNLDPNDRHDSPSAGNRDEAIRLALKAAIKDLSARLGPDMNSWRWDQLHQVTFNHPLGTAELLGPYFNRGPYPLGGDQTTIWATGASYHSLDSTHMIGPPYRMIVDLGDLRNSVSLLAPGQSGHPASLHYDDQVEAWFKAGYHSVLFFREDVDRDTRHLLRLTPRV